jgi:hypothetical protein
MHLIENVWTNIWKFWSVRIQIAAAFLAGLMIVDPATLLSAWNMMPEEIRNIMPIGFLQSVGAILFAMNVLTIMARGIQQKKVMSNEPASE